MFPEGEDEGGGGVVGAVVGADPLLKERKFDYNLENDALHIAPFCSSSKSRSIGLGLLHILCLVLVEQ